MLKINFKTLQLLRGIAAILVVFYHGVKSDKLRLLEYGFIGVDVFFVLSGFIIFYIHYSDIGVRKKLRPYLKKRFTRVYPLYLIVTLLYVALVLPFGHEFSLEYFLKSLFLLPQEKQPLVGVAWTLQHEFLFYSVFSLLFINKKLFYPLIYLWASSIVCLFLFPIQLINNPFIKLIFSPINLEFLFGCIVALIIIKKKEINLKWVTTLGVFLLIASLYVDYYGYLKVNRAIAWGIPAALIVLGLVKLEIGKRSLRLHKLLVFFGDASYSIYLTHILTILVLESVIERVNLFSVFSNSYLSQLVISTVSVFIGCLFYLFCERPLLKYIRNKFFVGKNKDPKVYSTPA